MIPPGTTVLLRPGDVVKFYGVEWIVTRVTESCATVLPMAKSVRTIVPHADPSKAVTVSSNGRAMSICTTICHGEIERRLGQEGLNNFLGPASRHRRTNNTTNEAREGEQDNMRILRHPDQAEARGGLAADAKQDKTNAEGTTSKGKLGTLFGHSVTSVLRRLGKEGVTTAHGRAIMKAMKIKASDATVQIQLGKGRNKEGEVADLTKAQVDELVKSPEPKEEPKAEPKAKGKGKGKGKKATAAVAA